MPEPEPTPKDRLIVERLIHSVRKSFGLTDQTCYAVAAPVFVPGQDALIVQVCLAGDRADGKGDGGQAGGSYVRRKGSILFACYVRLSVDQFGSTEFILTDHALGVMKVCNDLRELFKHTYLGTGVLIEPMMYEGGPQAAWVAESGGQVLRKDVRFSAPWVDAFGENGDGEANGLTLAEGDFQDMG